MLTCELCSQINAIWDAFWSGGISNPLEVMELDRLFQSPFTDLNTQGPLGIFPPATVSQIVQVLAGIRERAVA